MQEQNALLLVRFDPETHCLNVMKSTTEPVSSSLASWILVTFSPFSSHKIKYHGLKCLTLSK